MPAALPDLPADFSPLRPERHVALAVSGGSDSTALMLLARDWAASHHPALKLSILTVDHGLRPEAAAEARMVGAWASGLGLPHHVLDWEGPKPGTGLQAKARAARYGLLAGWCRAHGAGLLLTGHTLDDQAETVLMRLTRTLSPDSLSGIPAAGGWQGLAVFRPLLAVRREALRCYLSAMAQPWIDDPSNDNPRFERARTRQALTTQGYGGVTVERLAGLAEASARTAALLESLAGRWLALWLREEEAGICHVPAKPFLPLPAPLQQRILARIVRHYGGGQSSPEPEELRRLARWVEAGPVRCTLGGAIAGRRSGGFWVTREAGRLSSDPLTVPGSGEVVWDGRFLVKAAPGASVRAPGSGPLPLGGDIPVFARRAYPMVDYPGCAGARAAITFLRLLP